MGQRVPYNAPFGDNRKILISVQRVEKKNQFSTILAKNWVINSNVSYL